MVPRRFWSTVLLGLGAALGSAPALAQNTTSTTTTTSTATLSGSDFTIKLQRPDGNGDWEYLSSYDEGLYFNQGRCQCTDDSHGGDVRVVVQMASTARQTMAALVAAGSNAGVARIYVGTACAQLNASNTDANCPNGLLGEKPVVQFSTEGSQSWITTVGKIFAGAGASCTTTNPTTLWVWIRTGGIATSGNAPDLTGGNAPNKILKLDGTPPPTPANVVVEGGNDALLVSWGSVSPSDAPLADLAGYMVFCMRGDGIPVFSPAYFKDQYLTGSMCGGTPSVPSSKASIKGSTTAMEISPAPTFLSSFNPDYTCSGLISPSSTSARLRILQNGIPYTVGVAAVDLSGNISPITSGFLQKPVPTLDFYKEYREDGGDTQGGYCSLGGGTGKSKAVACLAGAGLLALSLVRRRRSRKKPKTGGLIALLAILGAGSAQAQAISRESGRKVDIDKTFEEPRNYRTSKDFAFELRFGAYRPDIDSEFSDGSQPYKDVYGGKRHLISQLEFDWQFFQAFGSLALGGQVGYFSQSAKAFVDDGTGNPKVLDGKKVRSGDSTSLRLIPLAALLVYRFDVLALQWGIPLVPYAKLGLNYTFWRISDGNGNTPSYISGGRGSGGTWGWQAAAGLALMLDFLDSGAARSLDMETGVNHTYFFFEWNKVAANGLGQSDKLHVGDSSWVIGLTFEF